MKLKCLCKFVNGNTFLFEKEDGSTIKVLQSEVYSISSFIQPGDVVTLVTLPDDRQRFIYDTEDAILVPEKKKRGRPKLPDSLKKKYVPTGRPRGRPKKLKQLKWEQHNG